MKRTDEMIQRGDFNGRKKGTAKTAVEEIQETETLKLKEGKGEMY